MNIPPGNIFVFSVMVQRCFTWMKKCVWEYEVAPFTLVQLTQEKSKL